MERIDVIKHQQEQLMNRYKDLIERAYSLKETDHEQSDISEYNAIKLLSKLKKLDYFLV